MNYDDSTRINTIKEYFQIYDKNNDGKITYDEVVSIIKALSHNPTEKEILEIIPDTSKNYDFSEYFDIMMKFKKIYSLESLIEKSKGINRDRASFIDWGVLENLMKNSSEKLTIDEIQEIKGLFGTEKNLSLNELVKYMYN